MTRDQRHQPRPSRRQARAYLSLAATRDSESRRADSLADEAYDLATGGVLTLRQRDRARDEDGEPSGYVSTRDSEAAMRAAAARARRALDANARMLGVR